MRTKEINLYQFNELSDEAKEKAISKLADINVDFEWWDGVYGDAENIGLKITEFDLYHGIIKGHIDYANSAAETAETILLDHGKDCETYKTAKTFLNDLEALTGQYTNIEDCPEDDIEALENEFIYNILEDYRIILQREYDYLTSEEAIIETIEANEYDFTEDGELS